MRRSFRGRSRASTDVRHGGDLTTGHDRKKIAQSLNAQGAGQKEKGGGARRGRGRIHSEPTSQLEHSYSPPPSGPDQVPPEKMGVVTHLTFAETHISGLSSSRTGLHNVVNMLA